jgi:hypothetical protein
MKKSAEKFSFLAKDFRVSDEFTDLFFLGGQEQSFPSQLNGLPLMSLLLSLT